MQEKWELEKQNLKLIIGIEAVSAKSEVYEGRWHEALDELEEMHKELKDIKAWCSKFLDDDIAR